VKKGRRYRLLKAQEMLHRYSDVCIRGLVSVKAVHVIDINCDLQEVKRVVNLTIETDKLEEASLGQLSTTLERMQVP
jgi:hypothetical protein